MSIYYSSDPVMDAERYYTQFSDGIETGECYESVCVVCGCKECDFNASQSSDEIMGQIAELERAEMYQHPDNSDSKWYDEQIYFLARHGAPIRLRELQKEVDESSEFPVEYERGISAVQQIKILVGKYSFLVPNLRTKDRW